MIRTEHYQRILLGLLITILCTNVWSILDNRRTRIITNHTQQQVIELLRIPPSEVKAAVEDVGGQVEFLRKEIESK